MENRPPYNFRRGIPVMVLCYLLWGVQSFYWYYCSGIDTLFLLASRTVLAAFACIILLRFTGKLGQLKEAFKDRNVIRKEFAASVFLFGDWAIYIWAVQHGKVMDASLGYFIEPIVVFFFGAMIFREKISWRHAVVLMFIIAGIILSARGFGGLPWVTITLALLFSVYAAIKKSLTLDSTVSTTLEIILMIPYALAILVFCSLQSKGLSGLSEKELLFIAGSGIVTAVPMLFYAYGVRDLPLTTVALCQYISPTCGIICGVLTGESFTREKVISFVFVWIGVILYVANSFHEARRNKRRNQFKV